MTDAHVAPVITALYTIDERSETPLANTLSEVLPIHQLKSIDSLVNNTTRVCFGPSPNVGSGAALGREAGDPRHYIIAPVSRHLLARPSRQGMEAESWLVFYSPKFIRSLAVSLPYASIISSGNENEIYF
ncbi:uncharacterized [Tachysurus ichikawai]